MNYVSCRHPSSLGTVLACWWEEVRGGGGGPPSSWRPLCVGSSPNMTGLSLLTQGDWAEGTTAHNRGTMAAPLVLMGDTCNRIRVRTPGGGPHGEMVHQSHPPNPSLSCPTPSNMYKNCESAVEGRLPAHHEVF